MYQPIWFSAVMATGIVALALRGQGLDAAGWTLAAIAAAVYVLLVIAHLRTRPRPSSRGEAIGLFAFVAATEVLSSVSQWHYVSLVLWAVGAAAWLPIAVIVLATPGRGVRGSWLLATVATDSLAVAGARLAITDFEVALAAAAWLLALTAYCAITGAILRRTARRELTQSHLDGDHWVTMGALAISTLAGSRVLGAMTLLGWHHGIRDAARVLATVAWIGALAWLPALIAAETWRLRRPPFYTVERWSTVFPLGMLAVASHALALTAGVNAGKPVATAFTAIGAAAWLAVTYAGIRAGSSSCSLKNLTTGPAYSSSRGQRKP